MNSRSKKDNRSRDNHNGSGGARSNDKSGDKGRSNNRRRKNTKKKKKKLDPTIFWGDPQALPSSDGPKATIASDPSAVVRSLGRPPLSGQQNAAEHYFTAVYDRAVNLAAALAAAGDLLESEELDGSHSFQG